MQILFHAYTCLRAINGFSLLLILLALTDMATTAGSRGEQSSAECGARNDLSVGPESLLSLSLSLVPGDWVMAARSSISHAGIPRLTWRVTSYNVTEVINYHEHLLTSSASSSSPRPSPAPSVLSRIMLLPHLGHLEMSCQSPECHCYSL